MLRGGEKKSGAEEGRTFYVEMARVYFGASEER
jgi:hypothetical protein